jgi:ribosomal protein L37E
MAIDDSGEWRVGSEATDIQEFLAAFTQSEGSYPTKSFRLVRCSCGSERFNLARAAEVTRRTCAACGFATFICRRAEDWEEAEAYDAVEPYSCVECDAKEANVVVGFAGYDENPEIDGVKWFYVVVRCAECGILGCFNDGKVGRCPAAEVYESV